MLRHGLAALVLLALLTPLVPVAGAGAGGLMACCRGTGDSCVCALTPGFARCDITTAFSPMRALPAVLGPSSEAVSLAVSFAAPVSPVETPASLALSPFVPPPRF